jgi:site-specific DNA-methyltransferase (adenine-specific)
MKQETKITEDNPQFGVQLRVIQPFYNEDGITIYNNDCLNVIDSLPPVDCIIADPPYGINLDKGYNKNYDQLVSGDDGFTVMFFLDDILTQYQEKLKVGGALYLFTRFDVAPYWWLKIKRYFTTKNIIIWDKGGGGVGDLEGNYINDYEMIIYATKGRHLLNGKREGAVWKIPKVKTEYHPTQKPEDIIMKIIEHSCPANGLILDPYMGSGTTLVAAKKLGRKAVGIELNPKYCDVAIDRLRQTTMMLK